MISIVLRSLVGISGILAMVVAFALDVTVRLRMKRTGEKWGFARGVTYDYGNYVKVSTLI